MKFKSALITQASGSIGGATFSHNKSGLYIRARSIPVNPDSPQQAVIKTAMSQLVNRWVSVLTTSQRNSWIVYAENVTITNKLGDQINISGNSMYTRSNVSRIQAGLVIVDDAPEVFNIGENDQVTASGDVTLQNLDISFSPAASWVNEDDSNLLIYIARPQNPTVIFFKGPYRFSGLITGDATTPPTSPQSIAVPFPIAVDQRIYFRTVVTRADGRYSDSFRGFGVGV